MTFNLISGAAEINKAIDSIATRGSRLRTDIHKAAVSCLAHIEAHGDVTVLSKLDAALPQGSNIKRMRLWAEAHGKVFFDEDTKEYRFSKKSETSVENAMETHPFDFNKEVEKTETVFDLTAEIIKLAERAQKKGVDEGKIKTLLAVTDEQPPADLLSIAA